MHKGAACTRAQASWGCRQCGSIEAFKHLQRCPSPKRKRPRSLSPHLTRRQASWSIQEASTVATLQEVRGPADVRQDSWTRHWRTELLDGVWNRVGLPMGRTMGQSTWNVIGDTNYLVMAPFVPVHCPSCSEPTSSASKPQGDIEPAATPPSHRDTKRHTARPLRINASRTKLTAYRRY